MGVVDHGFDSAWIFDDMHYASFLAKATDGYLRVEIICVPASKVSRVFHIHEDAFAVTIV
ncbi:hypothetical protein GFL51_30810 [Rhizobium leguminosarum bv. viciae]|nr:hypothetical protein [Rhizobium leguminosarum bv. viciae]